MKYYVNEISPKGNIAVDDTILIKGVPTLAGSRILEGFTPLFSAEAVERLEKKGYEISGKANVGEFGLDLVGEFSHYGEKEESLKGASASLIKDKKVLASLGVDVTGFPRRASAISGVDFLKSTYGTVSRYGIVSTAQSGEAVGVYAENAKEISKIMTIIAGHDEKDGTSLKNETYDYSIDGNVKGKKVAIVKELFEKCDDVVKAKVLSYKEKLESLGVVVEEISLDIFENANTAWQILMTAETCNNVSRYDGVKFGHRAKEYKNIDELYVNSRTEGFNFLTKAVILYGSDVLSKGRYEDTFQKSLKVRRVIYEKIEEIFKSYDAVLTPVTSTLEYKAYDVEQAFSKVFEESVFTSLANLTGIPALVSGSCQLLGAHLSEKILLSIADSVERMGE